MFTLTINFNTMEELVAFATSQNSSNIQKVEVDTEVEASSPVQKVKKSKVEKPKVVEAEVVEPEEIPEPPKVVKPAFNKDEAIKKVTQLIKEVTDSGVEGSVLASALAEVYRSTGCPVGVKISQLSDELLEGFLPSFINKAEELKNTAKQAPSFI